MILILNNKAQQFRVKISKSYFILQGWGQWFLRFLLCFPFLVVGHCIASIYFPINYQ